MQLLTEDEAPNQAEAADNAFTHAQTVASDSVSPETTRVVSEPPSENVFLNFIATGTRKPARKYIPNPSEASVERFDPVEMRCEVLRRIAREAAILNGRQPSVVQRQADRLPAASEDIGALQLLSWVFCCCNRSKGLAHRTGRQQAFENVWHAFSAAWTHVQMALSGIPETSLFEDPEVEELYQWRHMQQWVPRFDWAAAASAQMLFWDLLSNPVYRISLVLQFYGVAFTAITLHKVLYVLIRRSPRSWRNSRCMLLCLLLFGRGLICHAFPVGFSTAGVEALNPAASQAQELQRTPSLIGLGMTGLSAVLALRARTIDTMVMCSAHGLACLFWHTCAATSHLGNAFSAVVVGHFVVAVVCIWQQYDQEKYDRRTFEQELLMERGRLLRLCDNISRRATPLDFTINVQVLERTRASEHLHF